MIPTLYDKTGAVKIGDLNDCIECLVEEERNGIFELTMIYPANSSILESIVYDNIIVADANDYLKSQKFRVYNTRKLMANRIEVCARHISFDLVHDWVDVISIENQSCEYALNTIFRNSQFSKHFKGHSDIVNAQNFKVNKVTCLEAIGGTDGSIIDTYGTGAEILRDNTDIHVLNRRGHDNDVTIEYRKNLTGLEVEEDTTDLVTRIMPYAIYTNSNNEEVEVRGDFINSPLINNYAHPYVKYIDYSEEFEDGEVPTKTKLNDLATKEYTINKIDIPKCNYKIEFIPLSKCAGYEGLEDRINLCDVVTVKDSRYNIDTQAKVIKVVFDVLRGRYDSMELGEPRTTLGDIIGGTGDGPIQGPPGPPGPQGPAGADGSIGDFPQTLPEVPNITAKVYGFANIELSWTFENKVYYSYELYASKTKGFTPNAFNLIFSGQASTYLYQAEPNETWYFRACALNTHGQRTEFSEEVEVSTVKISDLSNYVESAAIGDALIGELNLGRGWYGELRGNYIDARQLSVTNGNGVRTLDIDSFGNVNFTDVVIQLNHTNGNKYFLLNHDGIVMFNPANGVHQWGKIAAINGKFTIGSNGNSSGLSLGHHVNQNYAEDILCDSNGVVHIQRQTEHNGVYYNNYGQVFIRQSGQGGWEITGRSDSQSIKPGGANQGAIGSDTQYINQSWIANRQNPSSLEYKHLSHYVEDLECLKLVSEVQPARYFYKEYDEEGNDITTFTTRTSQLGLIYEDVRECEGRDLITNEEDKAINLYNMVSTLWGAVRNLNKRLNELEAENLDLKSKLTAVEDL
jgi:phage minor structural protein|nr:MAG TPA: tail protein [Caudoviricetes sp.]